RNKLGFADGSIVEPPQGDPQYLAWRRNDSILASWILNSVSNEIQASAVYSNSAFDI
ncbi:receptor-like serine/threonine kinase, partial [Trifolium medium]|nr:receptor-like serine/threonine kinase [Trifolium medium]